MSAGDFVEILRVSEPIEPGDLVAVDIDRPGLFRRTALQGDPTVVGIATDDPRAVDGRVAVVLIGTTRVKVDAGYGSIRPSSPTSGHAMRAHEILPGTVVGKALEAMDAGTGTIRVLVTGGAR